MDGDWSGSGIGKEQVIEGPGRLNWQRECKNLIELKAPIALCIIIDMQFRHLMPIEPVVPIEPKVPKATVVLIESMHATSADSGLPVAYCRKCRKHR